MRATKQPAHILARPFDVPAINASAALLGASRGFLVEEIALRQKAERIWENAGSRQAHSAARTIESFCNMCDLTPGCCQSAGARTTVAARAQ